MDQNHREFLLVEYDALRREIELGIKELTEFLRYAILASGAIWAWLLTQKPMPLSRVAGFIPLVLVAVLFGEILMERKHIRWIGAYLARIERHFSLPEHLGWETHHYNRARKDDWFPRWENSIWIGLCVINLAGGIFLAVR